MARLFLIHGFIASGKTRFAKELEQAERAFRITHDEWMAQLYGQDPDASDFARFYNNVSQLAWETTGRLLELNQSVILDFGFWTRASRDEARAKARQLEVEHRLVDVSCPAALMRERLRMRNSTLSDGDLFVSEDTFASLLDRFEPLQSDEDRIRPDGREILPYPKK